MNLLFAEDDALLAQLFQLQAETAGHQVVWVENGDLAVQHALSYQFDIILMDVQMPRMNGLQATQLIRQMPGKNEFPILALTAGAMLAEHQSALEAGMDDVLTKPIDSAVVVRSILKHVQTKSL